MTEMSHPDNPFFVRFLFVIDVVKVNIVKLLTEIQSLLSNAKLLQKRSLRKDYYKILGIHKDASTEEIKKAYRKRALVHHPGQPFFADFVYKWAKMVIGR